MAKRGSVGLLALRGRRGNGVQREVLARRVIPDRKGRREIRGHKEIPARRET